MYEPSSNIIIRDCKFYVNIFIQNIVNLEAYQSAKRMKDLSCFPFVTFQNPLGHHFQTFENF